MDHGWSPANRAILLLRSVYRRSCVDHEGLRNPVDLWLAGGGKGRRERVLPLWKEKQSVLRNWLAIRPSGRDDHLFLNARGTAMSRHGFTHRLALHVATAQRKMSSLPPLLPRLQECRLNTPRLHGDPKRANRWLNVEPLRVFRLKYLSIASCAALSLALCLSSGAANAQSLERLIERLDRLEQESRQLRREIDEIKAERTAGDKARTKSAGKAPEGEAAGYVRIDSDYGYEILDPTTDINRKQRLILDRKREGTLAPDSVHVHGAVTAVANYQFSNRADKFGYLMRHPTASNQVGKEVSEATIHSAQLGFTATLGDWIAGHAVMLFDPEQSFGEGTNTDLERNQVQVRRAYALFGNLDRSPLFASLGKMAVPFGLTDTVNPFTASTVWHAFGGLANGVSVGYASEGLNLTAMGIQGGSQFRAVNAPVEGTNVPSRVNNFAGDANYAFRLGRHGKFLVGGSYLHGSAY